MIDWATIMVAGNSCCACGNKEMGPLLQNKLWNSISACARFLCEDCMVIRLRRPLQISDLRNAPWNHARNIALKKLYPRAIETKEIA